MKVTPGSPEPTKTASSESEPERIIYGGSFDPPHLGHAALAKKILQRFPRARLDVIVAAAPAGAYGQHKTTSASFDQRLEMCRMNFAVERAEVNPIEARLEKPNYTWRTLEALQREDGETRRWALLMGQDQFENFPGWKKADELIDQLDLIVVDRDGFASWPETEAKFSSSFFALQKIDEATFAWQGKKGRIYRLTGDTSPAASRILRQGIEGNESWLSPEVLAFIQRNKLYKAEEV